MRRMHLRATVIAGSAVLLAVLPALAQRPATTSREKGVFDRCGTAMEHLAEDSNQLLDELRTLTKEQRNAVVALMAVTRAAAAYESRFMRQDDAPLRALYGSLSQFSPAYMAPGKFETLLNGCFDATVACLSAQKKCLDEGGKNQQCDQDPRVVEPCANEAICFMNAFIKLHQGIPEILVGRDPWPPQPFPY